MSLTTKVLVPDSLSCWRSSLWLLGKKFDSLGFRHVSILMVAVLGFSVIIHAYGFVWLERALMPVL